MEGQKGVRAEKGIYLIETFMISDIYAIALVHYARQNEHNFATSSADEGGLGDQDDGGAGAHLLTQAQAPRQVMDDRDCDDQHLTIMLQSSRHPASGVQCRFLLGSARA